MVAPMDARATVTAGDETFELVMNYRTIALAEDTQPDSVTSFGTGKPKLSGLATLLWAFAQPARPDMTLDEALSLAMRHGAAVGEALATCFTLATKGAAGDDDAGPRPPGRRSRAN